jgi:hypothetical protein
VDDDAAAKAAAFLAKKKNPRTSEDDVDEVMCVCVCVCVCLCLLLNRQSFVRRLLQRLLRSWLPRRNECPYYLCHWNCLMLIFLLSNVTPYA